MGQTGLSFNVRVGKANQTGFASDNCIMLDNKSYVKEAMDVEGFREALQKVHADLQLVKWPGRF